MGSDPWRQAPAQGRGPAPRPVLSAHWWTQASVTGAQPRPPVPSGFCSVRSGDESFNHGGGAAALCPSPASQTRLNSPNRSREGGEGAEDEPGASGSGLRACSRSQDGVGTRPWRCCASEVTLSCCRFGFDRIPVQQPQQSVI